MPRRVLLLVQDPHDQNTAIRFDVINSVAFVLIASQAKADAILDAPEHGVFSNQTEAGFKTISIRFGLFCTKGAHGVTRNGEQVVLGSMRQSIFSHP